jgi:hypothetical protein
LRPRSQSSRPAAALGVATVYDIVSGGLDDGNACLSSTGAGGCSASSLFGVPSTFGVTGTIAVDGGSVDVDITLPTGSMTGGHNGVAEVVFENTRYSVTGMAAMQLGNQLLGLGTTGGSAVGTYTQLNGASVPVAGPTGFGEATDFSAFSCLFSGSSGNCGFTIGANRGFDLAVGGDSLDFRHTFNVGVREATSPVPEPNAALAFVLGLVIVGPHVARVTGRRAASL